MTVQPRRLCAGIAVLCHLGDAGQPIDEWYSLIGAGTNRVETGSGSNVLNLPLPA